MIPICKRPNSPIREIIIENSYCCPMADPVTKMDVFIDGNLGPEVFDSLQAWGKDIGIVEDVHAKRVIFSGPATVTFFTDGTKTVTKAKDGDEFDPLFGLMACALRKVGNNRVRIDAWEDEISFLADSLGSADECRVLADMLNSTAEAWELGEVADFMGKWAEEHGVEEPNVTFSANTEGFNEVVLSDEVHEAVRQDIRNLIDKGEL